jgi:WD40 repeat protein/tRNA A-37 threonylcarbamoyl transferase component Bud32
MQVSDDTLAGTEVGGYGIETLLGRGGMGVVYLAEDRWLKRRVALKVLASRVADDRSFREYFLRESRLAASIDHPNIVPIYEAGTTNGLLYLAMRYVEGGDLKLRLKSGPLDALDAIGIVTQVAGALEAAHERGLVHRDVKPSNVLLDVGARPDGSDHAYLADFGITKRMSDRGEGGDGPLSGTIDYVAPEQIAGGQIDGRADIYSLGCVLYECLVGAPPFRCNSNLAVVFAHLEAAPPVPSELRPELPAELDAVVARALAKEPAERYATCREFARAALAVAVHETSRLLGEAASRAAAGRNDLIEVQAELAGKVIDLQLAREQVRALAGPITAPGADGPVRPFKGLASFEPVDAEFFFGRERPVGELVARLAGGGFVGIVGPSGSGKSSLLRAGLLPALAAGVLPGSEGWRRVLLRPGERPMAELRRALGSEAADPLADAICALPRNSRLLLAVDQLEELFTAGQSDAERAAFVDALARAAADTDGRAVVVVSLRADFYGRFATYPDLAELLGRNHVLIGPMPPSNLRRAVELPAARAGLRVESELVDALVDDVQGEPGGLPLLSTTLLELWQKREDNTLTLSAYLDSGGVEGAVARLAEGTYARIPVEDRAKVRMLMLRLVGDDEGERPVRRRAPLAELDLERDEELADVLATLADSRLVSIGDGFAEVAHEALLSEWPRLRQWIEDDAAGRRLRHHLTQAATDWDAAGRDSGELYRGARLAAALDWTAGHALDLNDLERAFIDAGREAFEQETRRARRTNRRLRTLLAGVAVLLVVALIGGIFAVLQRGEARDAAGAARDAETAQVAQRLGAQALVEGNLDLSLLLARQAVAIDDTPQTRGYLLAALLRAPAAVGLMHGDDDALLQGIALSPDGKTLAVLDFFKKLLFFDPRSYEQVGEPLAVSTWLQSVAYSPDGKTLVYGGGGTGPDAFLRRLDAGTREQLAETSMPGFPVQAVFTNDGTKLIVVTVSPSGGAPAISVRDPATLEEVGPTIEPDGFARCYISSVCQFAHVALTSDGRAVITASDGGELVWWDLQSGRRERTLTIGTGHHALALSPDGQTAAVGVDGGIQWVDVRSGTVTTAPAYLVGRPGWLLFSPDGSTVVSANVDGTSTLWDVESQVPRETLRGHSGPVSQPVFSADGETLYTVSGDGSAIAWDLAGDRSVKRQFRFTDDGDFDESYDGHPGRFSPDGRLIAVGLKDHGIALWDADELVPSGVPLVETGGEVKAIAFSPDGRLLAAVASDGQLTIWDVASRSLRHGPKIASRGYLVGVAFTDDGTTVVTSGDAGVRLWDATTGDPLTTYAGAASNVAVSPDGSLVASAFDGAQVRDLRTGTLIATTEPDPEADELSVAFSPDGRTLAVGGYGRFVRLWDFRTGRLVRQIDVGSATALEFSPDGRNLVVSGGVSLSGGVGASVWDLATGTQIGPTLTAGRRMALTDLSPDGRRLLMTAANGEGAVWDVDSESLAQRACNVANRTLTPEEWETFLPDRPYEPACA